VWTQRPALGSQHWLDGQVGTQTPAFESQQPDEQVSVHVWVVASQHWELHVPEHTGGKWKMSQQPVEHVLVQMCVWGSQHFGIGQPASLTQFPVEGSQHPLVHPAEHCWVWGSQHSPPEQWLVHVCVCGSQHAPFEHFDTHWPFVSQQRPCDAQVTQTPLALVMHGGGLMQELPPEQHCAAGQAKQKLLFRQQVSPIAECEHGTQTPPLHVVHVPEQVATHAPLPPPPAASQHSPPVHKFVAEQTTGPLWQPPGGIGVPSGQTQPLAPGLEPSAQRH